MFLLKGREQGDKNLKLFELQRLSTLTNELWKVAHAKRLIFRCR